MMIFFFTCSHNQADILVSELLGSFGDNELSPECLDGAQVFLKGLFLACYIQIPKLGNTYIYIYIYVCVCLCVCLSVCLSVFVCVT